MVCIANANAELETCEFQLSMPITHAIATEKYLLFLAGRKLYASSLLERNEGETTFERNEFDDVSEAAGTSPSAS